MSSTETGDFAQDAERVARDEREIQRNIDAQEGRSFGGGQEGAMQAGARRYPEPPFPEQHLEKPGLEAELQLQPMYDAPFYKGSDRLKDKVALITGADSGIGRAVAVLFAREGADVAIAYLNEHEDAEQTKRAVEKEGRRAILLPGDVADPAYARSAVERTVEEFGGLDVLVNNAAFQEEFGASTQMKRPAQPEEIAPAFVFLASSHCSSLITGEILPILGGYSGG